MARKLRVEYEGAIYHIMNRGDRREPIFKDDAGRKLFLETLAEACQKTGWQVHAFCLMSNHFHLVVETPQPNLVAGMKWFLGTYTGRFNRWHKQFGHLFSGRYKSLVVDGSGTGYLKAVCDYVHLNPARAKLLSGNQRLTSYRWSNYPLFLLSPGKRPSWLRVERLFGEMRIPRDSAAGRREFERLTEKRCRQEEVGAFNAVRRGWCFGDTTFKKELLAQMAESVGANHYGPERHESAEERAERIVAEELKRWKWTVEDLRQRAKGDSRKVRIAQRLRRETTMPLKWIAQRLEMGSWTYVSNLLSASENGREPKEPESANRESGFGKR